MRFVLFLLFCGMSLSAAAQWWRIDLSLKKHERFPQLFEANNHSVAALNINTAIAPAKISRFTLSPSNYRLELEEAAVMKTAQRNMRYGDYSVASYNFSDLAQLYVQQNRLAEAKWYYLQSIDISRRENNDRHTISNLMGLALIKAMLNDFESSRRDLVEALDLAKVRNLAEDQQDVEKEMKYIVDNRVTLAKTHARYAEAVKFK